MIIEEAIVYVLASSGRGMSTGAIASAVNSRRLFSRRDGREVDHGMVYAVVKSRPDVFVVSGGLVHLLL